MICIIMIIDESNKQFGKKSKSQSKVTRKSKVVKIIIMPDVTRMKADNLTLGCSPAD